ncbi:MAG: response regulator transcription factor [Acidimicrobiia bacterium]
MKPSRTVLVIEDEVSIAQAVAARLRSEGFAVEIAGDGPTGVEACQRIRPDLVVLDLMLPGIDGLEVCERIQADRSVPVLMLTARDSEADLVLGFTVGADDYLTKPFSSRELVARVHAILRRVDRARAEIEQGIPLEGSDRATGRQELGGMTIDGARRVVTRGDDVVHLTPTEFDLLRFLAARPGTVRTREELLAEVWGVPMVSSGRTVDSHIRALRRKLGSDIVRTVHGVGYAISEDDAETPSEPGGDDLTGDRA